MPINSKAKGKRFELRLAGILRDYGFQDCRRTAQYCGNTGNYHGILVVQRLPDWITMYRPYFEEVLGRDVQCPTES